MPSCFSSCCISRKFSSRRSNLPLRKSCQDLGRRGWFTRAGRWIDNREGRDEGRAKLPLSRLFPADVAARQEARPPLAYRRPPDTVTRTVSHAGNRPRMGEALKGRSNLAQAARRDRSCFCESNVASPPTPGRPFRAEVVEGFPFPGRCPGLAWAAPSGLNRAPSIFRYHPYDTWGGRVERARAGKGDGRAQNALTHHVGWTERGRLMGSISANGSATHLCCQRDRCRGRVTASERSVTPCRPAPWDTMALPHDGRLYPTPGRAGTAPRPYGKPQSCGAPTTANHNRVAHPRSSPGGRVHLTRASAASRPAGRPAPTANHDRVAHPPRQTAIVWRIRANWGGSV